MVVKTKIDRFCIQLFWHCLERLANERECIGFLSKLVYRGIPRTGSHQVFDLLNRLNTAACADAGAVQSRRGAGKVEPFLQGPALKERADKTGVKNIPRARGVHGLDAKGARVVNSLSIPS